MFHIDIIKDGDVTKVVKETLVDGQMYVDDVPREGSPNLVTSGGVSKANADIIDDGDETGLEIVFDTEAAYNTYELGKYYVLDGKIYLCTTRSKTGNSAPYTYEVVLTKMNGVVESLNSIVEVVDIIDFGDKTESDIVDGVYAVNSSNSHTELTLTTVAVLTIKANPGLGNFEMLIDNSGNTNDVTITVKSNDGSETYLHSSVAGTDVAAGKIFQLTCVGKCWTIAEVEA